MTSEGIALWRQIGEAVLDDIDTGALKPGDRLPSSDELASRFHVNRHTILKAISHLQNEGLVRVVRGRGTYVVENAIQYRMGAKTRFEENLAKLNSLAQREIVDLRELQAAPDIAKALNLELWSRATLASLLGLADGIPISYSHNYFPTERMPEIERAFRRLSGNPSITKALEMAGVTDFRKKDMRIRGRQATVDEANVLRIPPAEGILEIEVTNVDANDIPVMYASTCFPTSRVEFVMDF